MKHHSASSPGAVDSLRQKRKSPELWKIIDLISKQNPLQRKRIEAFVAQQDDEFWAFAENLSRTLNHSFLTDDEDRLLAARSYNKMCMDFLSEQIRFKKSGVYKLKDAEVAFQDVYSNLRVMRYYMVGLLLSYMFWPNHYQLFRFLRHNLPKKPVQKYLEVGVGHGLFTTEVLSTFPTVDATGIDISETSIRTAKEMLQTFQIDTSGLRFVHSDYLKAELPKGGYDFIVMGEVLEHVNDAPLFLDRTHELLKPGGQIYLTTCANCPAIDHIYHFHSVRDIREHLQRAKFKIIKDIALPSDPIPESDWERELITINYAAILELA